VFLLAGQSNMEGHGVVDLDDALDYNGGRGTLQAFLREPANAAAWPGLHSADGTWVQRDDVFVTYRCEHGPRKVGPLSIGFGAYEGKHHIGPELGIGRALGDHFAGRSLRGSGVLARRERGGMGPGIGACGRLRPV
jgi:hypothetical protein